MQRLNVDSAMVKRVKVGQGYETALVIERCCHDVSCMRFLYKKSLSL